MILEPGRHATRSNSLHGSDMGFPTFALLGRFGFAALRVSAVSDGRWVLMLGMGAVMAGASVHCSMPLSYTRCPV